MQSLQLPQDEVLGLLTDFEGLFLDFNAALNLLLHKPIGSSLNELSHLVAKDAPAQSKLFSEHDVDEIEQEDC